MEGDVGEGGDEAEELGEYVGRLLEVLYVDLGVDFFRLIQAAASLQDSHHFPLQNPSHNHASIFLFFFFFLD